MTFRWEEIASREGPMPDGLCLSEQRAFQAMVLLYRRFNTKAITPEQASVEKRQIGKQMMEEISADNFRDNTAYGREKILRLSEQARTRARKEPTKENLLALIETIDGILKNELQQNVILSEHGANCPCCGKFFNQEHADRKPRFCEDCGAMLVW